MSANPSGIRSNWYKWFLPRRHRCGVGARASARLGERCADARPPRPAATRTSGSTSRRSPPSCVGRHCDGTARFDTCTPRLYPLTATDVHIYTSKMVSSAFQNIIWNALRKQSLTFYVFYIYCGVKDMEKFDA
jgi:hypothetical protein